MAVTKTNFINYIRCPRYVALDKLKKDKLNSAVTLTEYRKEEEEQYAREILGPMSEYEEQYLQEILETMFDEEGNDLIDTIDEHLSVMLPYYNRVEQLAGKLASKYFTGDFIYSKDVHNQESFDCLINGIRYMCYVDIYNQNKDDFNIIEVKATTSNTFLDIGKSERDEFDKKEIIPIFQKGIDKIYHLLEETNDIEQHMPEDKYFTHRKKLLNRFNAAGHYVYDLAVQRYFIENDLNQHNLSHKIPNIKYYLAVLNRDYICDNNIQNEEYPTDSNGNDIVCYFDMTKVTSEFMDIIDLDRQRVEKYINELCIDKYPIGEHCENKKTTKCKYIKECWKSIPAKNSIFNYIDNHRGFIDQNNNKYNRYDLANDGKVRMLDLPESMLNREKNVIQRRVVESHDPYINKNKIKAGLATIEYPIYHLDFETFPCPLPRYRGEKCYSQSVFQFSLHIEREPGVCDKDKDHYEFLAKDHNDNREALIARLCELIDVDKGGIILVYNESFEKTRLKELGEIFPIYKSKLNKMRDMIFDLLYLVKTNTSFYQELGYDQNEAKMFNYYHYDMSGSFSIKKVLPLFSSLSYEGMDVGNGMDAIITYASFPKLSKEEYNYKYHKLLEYCKQDTWAMVEVLHGLINTVK